MNKKFLAAGAGLAVLALSATFVLSMGKTGATTLAGEVTHSHGSSCIIHHYAQVDPTSEKSGVKEYWICCSDPTHTVSYSNPGVGSITDATHGDDFAIDSSDARYIAPYSFPEVFSSQMAYDTPVTIADGKVTSSTGTIKIKAGVLKDAYEHGYTHMKFHSNAESSDVTNICGIQSPTWKSYSKRYKNNQDNRFWLKSFSEAGEGLSIDSLKLLEHINTNLTLSDFSLFKSASTETWGAGSDFGGYKTVGSTYIAYEDGELVMDVAGNGKYLIGGEIPASIMGSTPWGYRSFYVKKLAYGAYSDDQSDDSEDLVMLPRLENGSEIESPYYLEGPNGKTQTTDDGFSNVWFAKQPTRDFGLVDNLYDAGALSVGFNNPGAYAIRLNKDFQIGWTNNASCARVVPQKITSGGMDKVVFEGITTTSTDNQINIGFPVSTSKSGMKAKIISTAKPTANFHPYNAEASAHVLWPTFALTDGVYVWESTYNFNEGILWTFCFEEVVTDASVTFEYSWID